MLQVFIDNNGIILRSDWLNRQFATKLNIGDNIDLKVCENNIIQDKTFIIKKVNVQLNNSGFLNQITYIVNPIK